MVMYVLEIPMNCLKDLHNVKYVKKLLMIFMNITRCIILKSILKNINVKSVISRQIEVTTFTDIECYSMISTIEILRLLTRHLKTQRKLNGNVKYAKRF